MSGADAGISSRLLRWSVVLALAGLALGTALIGWFGAGLVFREVLSVGAGGFALVCAWQLVLFVGLGLAWGALLPRGTGVSLIVPVWGRMVRDSAGNCLPFSQIGGFAAGARATVLAGLSWPMAAASTAADVAAELLAQLGFVGVGLSILVARHPGSQLVWPALAGLVVGIAAALGFVWAQRGGSGVFGVVMTRMLGAINLQAEGQVSAVQAALAAIHAEGWRFWLSTALHLLNWLGTGVADWIAYNLLGAHIDLLSAFAIDSLLHAALAMAVLVPGYAGIQEAAYVGIGALFGQTASISLAVSLLRRARDLSVGLPILVSWQAAEWRARRA